MERYLKALYLFLTTAIGIEMEYQLNFIVELIAMIGTLSGSIFILSLFFTQDQQLGNWNWEQALIIQGIYTLLDGITNTVLRPNLREIVNYVREGTLDFVLLKPIDSQFWVSLRTFSPSGLPEIGLGATLVIYACNQLGVVLNINQLVRIIIILASSSITLYSIWFLVAATSIWFVKTWNATEVLRALLSAGRYPVSAYSLMLRLIFTLILPITFLTTVPAEIIIGDSGYNMIYIGILIAVFFFSLSRMFWIHALKYYTSASS